METNTSNLNQDWFKRVLSILGELNNKIKSKNEFHLIKVIEYLIKNDRVDEARENLSLLTYCIEKHLEVKNLDSVIIERLVNVYDSSAFFDLKLHLNPINIDQSTLNYYSDRVEDFLTRVVRT
ncbi:hypothetical protein CEQ90_19815 [Lewinellaceae bacterium SD302]|nr:hypothetical protein CEQ90_19815 [Lewinellaceae bacterium SD302]